MKHSIARLFKKNIQKGINYHTAESQTYVQSVIRLNHINYDHLHHHLFHPGGAPHMTTSLILILVLSMSINMKNYDLAHACTMCGKRIVNKEDLEMLMTFRAAKCNIDAKFVVNA